MKKPNSLKRAKKFLATERVLPNTQAIDSTKPGYLAERMAQWRELQAAERAVHAARKEHGTIEHTEKAGELLSELVKEVEAYAADAERFRWLAERTAATGLARWVHPFQFLADAVDARRGVSRPPTPVGWSDTDWLKHLEEIRQNEAAYARGPLLERGWD